MLVEVMQRWGRVGEHGDSEDAEGEGGDPAGGKRRGGWETVERSGSMGILTV